MTNQPDTEWEDFAQDHLNDVSPMTYSLISDFFKITRAQEYNRGRADAVAYIKANKEPDGKLHKWVHIPEEVLDRASDISATE